MAYFTRRIVVVGTGYVGLTTGACLASLGHRVVCADVDRAKVERLRAAQLDIREPGLAELVAEMTGRRAAVVRRRHRRRPRRAARRGHAGRGHGAVRADTDGHRRRRRPGGGGGRDRGGPGRPAAGCGRGGTSRRSRSAPASGSPSCWSARTWPWSATRSSCARAPAVHDFLHPGPDRRRLGRTRTRPSGWPRSTPGSARRRCSPTRASAELIKYAANCFLAMKLSYVNALAELCERLGRRRRRRHRGARLRPADRPVLPVARSGLGRLLPAQGHRTRCCRSPTPSTSSSGCCARRSTPTPGSASGWSTRSGMAVTGRRTGPLTRTPDRAARAGVQGRHRRPARLARARRGRAAAAGRRRAGRPTTRPSSPPTGPARRRHRAGRGAADASSTIPYVAAKDADAVVILTEWPEFRGLDWSRLAAASCAGRWWSTPATSLDPDVLDRAGFSWTGVGRLPRVAS